MTLPAHIRIFFAVELSEALKEELGQFIIGLKKQARTHGIRWTKPENLHVTLQFIGQVHSEHLPKLLAQVRSRLEANVKNIEVNFGSLHLFPNPYRPRVIVLDVGPQAELAWLSGLIGQGIEAMNYEIEDRPFRAHLTLGRIKQPQGVNLNFMTNSELPNFSKLPLKEVVLFRSEPQPEGSQYSVIEKISIEKKLTKKTG